LKLNSRDRYPGENTDGLEVLQVLKLVGYPYSQKSPYACPKRFGVILCRTLVSTEGSTDRLPQLNDDFIWHHSTSEADHFPPLDND